MIIPFTLKRVQNRIAGTILRSSDGIKWMRCSSETTDVLNKVAFGNGTFVAVGDLGVVVTSTNGVDWETRNSSTTVSLYDVAYGDNTFVAVGVSVTT